MKNIRVSQLEVELSRPRFRPGRIGRFVSGNSLRYEPSVNRDVVKKTLSDVSVVGHARCSRCVLQSKITQRGRIMRLLFGSV